MQSTLMIMGLYPEYMTVSQMLQLRKLPTQLMAKVYAQMLYQRLSTDSKEAHEKMCTSPLPTSLP